MLVSLLLAVLFCAEPISAAVNAGSWSFQCAANATATTITAGKDQTGRTILITGGDSRAGIQIAIAASRSNATVILACRNMTKALITAQEVRSHTHAGKVETIQLDLADLQSIRKAATELMGRQRVLDVLINNAGVLTDAPEKTGDGFVETMQVNHLGPALFTQLLLPSIRRSVQGRIVHVASGSAFDVISPPFPYQALSVNNVRNLCSNKSALDSGGFYALSKFLQVHHASELARREPRTLVFSVNPGFFRDHLPRPLPKPYQEECTSQILFTPCPQTDDQGSAVIAFAAMAPLSSELANEFSGSMLDFRTTMLPVDPFWKQDGVSCVPREKPHWAAPTAHAWYDAALDLLLRPLQANE